MKLQAKLALVLTVLTSLYTQSNAQIDTTWTYFHYRTDGTRVAGPVPGGVMGAIPVDIRLVTDEEYIPNDYQTKYFLIENNTFSHRLVNGQPSTTYFPMASFTSTNYTQGQLRRQNPYSNKFVMNYRLLFPRNYPTNPDVPGGYPLIIMAHGFGERANCWGTNCYWGTTTYNPNDNNNPPVNNTRYNITSVTSAGSGTQINITTSAPHGFSDTGYANQIRITNSTVAAYNGNRTVVQVISATQFRISLTFSGNATGNVESLGGLRLLNNDHSMTHGGAVHQTAVLTTTPAGMVPDDPTMPIRAFPGFIFYPQNLNGWEQGGAQNAVRILRLLMKKYNINPNKVYVHGLSDGGSATYRLVRTAPWLFAGALPMSAVNNPENGYPIYPHISSVPLWIFQGGVDGNPTKAHTEGLIQNFRNAGMDVRYTLYPTLGHGVWNNAYAEQDFFRWMMLKNKANISVKFNNRTVCGTSGVPTELFLAQGFFNYQWERDGQLIAGANSYNYLTTQPGTYRARFSRIDNRLPPVGPPSGTGVWAEADWNRWSDPIVITEVTPDKPIVKALNSTVFPTVNPWPDVTVTLQPSQKSEKYNWFINGAVATNLWKPGPPPAYVGTSDTTYRILAAYDRLGAYTLKTNNISGCQSPSSDPVHVINPATATLTAPGNFAGTAQNGSSIFLSWTDNSPNENGFEVWRRKAGDTNFTFVIRTQEDAVSYLDTNLTPVTTYHYKLRAVSNTDRSSATPSDDMNTNLVVATLGDAILPTPPQNLQVTINTINSISLAWDPGTDNNGVNRYKITYTGTPSGSAFTTGPTTMFTISGLVTNSSYQISVQTEDLAGNLSPPSNQITGLTYVDGLFYEHSTGAWSWLTPSLSAGSDNPPIDWTTAEFTGKISNFNVNPSITYFGEPPGIATQQDFYKIKFSGYITRPTGAFNNIFQFRMISNDGAMLFLNGFDPNFTPSTFTASGGVINNDGIYDWTTSADVTLSSAFVPIVVLFREFIDGQNLTVQYRRKLTSSTYELTWTTIPDAMLRTGTPPNPTLPNVPTALVATAAGMTSVNLTWSYIGPAAQFEVYRSTSSTGIFEIIGLAPTTAFTDNTVLPNTTYYYKLKSVNANGASNFSNTDDATTDSDLLAPSVPAFLTLISKTFSNIAFSWTASTDNVGVAGYLILVNGTVVDTATVTSHMVTGLEPGTLYNFTVKAFDATGNESAASSVLAVTTNGGVTYYSKASGALNVANTWGLNPDGSGTVPNLTYNGQNYTVANRTSTGLGGALTIGGTVSKIIVPNGTTLNVDNTISAKLEVQGNGVVNLDNSSTAPEFLSVSPTSTVNFNSYASIPAGTYGHIGLTGTGNKNFATGETVIMGNLTATTGIGLKGEPGNTSRVTVHGNITLAGTPGAVATDNALDLTMASAGTKTLTVSGALDLFELSTASGTNVNVVNGGSAITLNVGSPNGGGLVLANGTTLNIGNNHLVLKNTASINAGGETGRLAINGSNLTLSSSNAQNSNLYLDNVLNTAGMVTTTFSGTGDLMIQSPLKITDGLKINAGEVNSAGNITLASTQAKTAYLQEIEGNGGITGNAKVERWVSIARKYRYMSSVVDNMTVANWQTYMPITGPFTGANTNATAPSMFYYVENGGGYLNYPATGSDNTVTFEQGRGYSIFNFNGNSPLTLTMTGNPYQGSIPFTLTPAGGPNPGWNLVGNPYASAIQWNNLASDWTLSEVSTSIAVPDNTSGTLVQRTYDSQTGLGTLTGGIIAPGQAFWVQTTGEASMTVHEKAKRTNTSTFYREGDSHVNSITIRLSNGAKEDVGYVILGENYSDAYEPENDGMKYKNQVLNLSTRSIENVNLVFNKLSDSFCEKTVALVLEDVTPGTYSLAFDNIENLVGVGAVELTDHFTDTTLPITNSTPYSFAVTSEAASFGAGRFTLTLNRPALQKNAIATVENLCGGTLATIQLTNTQEGVFYYATKANESNLLSGEVIGTGGSIVLEIPVSALQTGTNSVVIHTGFKGCSAELLTTAPLAFTYNPSPVVTVTKPFYSLCAESQVTLTAETNSANTLHWYKDGVLMANQTSANWISDPLKKSTLFEVAAVNNGCEGPKTSVYVEINKVSMPIVEFTGKDLEIVTEVPADNFVQWYLNNSPMNAFEKSITPTEEGIYTVLVAKSGCSVISDPFEYLVTGIENPFNEPFHAYVYPNPATFDQLYVKLETTSKQNAKITMVDLGGRTVFMQSINGNEGNGVHKLNVAQETAPGLYILQIQQGDAVLQRKVILHFK